MGACIPFSDIDQFTAKSAAPMSCLVDSSFLVALSDKDHSQHESAQFIGEKFSEYDAKVFASVTVRSEFIDYHRRVIITETLMGMLAPSSPWKIPAAVRAELKSQQGWIDNQPKAGNEPYLSDSRIKSCKQVFLPKTQSGHIGWMELCKEYLDNNLLTAWESISDTLNINYVDMRSEDSRDLFRKDLDWRSMYKMAEHTALGSHDAMILNLLDSSVLPLVITMDFDLAYGVMASTADKVALVPDNLYRNRLKKLKF